MEEVTLAEDKLINCIRLISYIFDVLIKYILLASPDSNFLFEFFWV